MAALITRLGPAGHLIAELGGVVAYLTHPTSAERTARNHRRADPSLDERGARRRARASFRQYARLVTDTLWISGATSDAILRRTELVGWQHIVEARAHGRGAVLTMCHVGNWDMAVAVGLARGLRITSVMAPVGPRWLTSVVAWERTRRGLRLHDVEAAARGFLRTLRGGDLVGVMMDIPEAGPVTVVDFCGGRVRFSSVAAWLALRTGAPILAVDCWRTRRGHRLEVGVPIYPAPGEDPAAVTQRLARHFERGLGRHPEQWYPFHDVYVAGPAGV